MPARLRLVWADALRELADGQWALSWNKMQWLKLADGTAPSSGTSRWRSLRIKMTLPARKLENGQTLGGLCSARKASMQGRGMREVGKLIKESIDSCFDEEVLRLMKKTLAATERWQKVKINKKQQKKTRENNNKKRKTHFLFFFSIFSRSVRNAPYKTTVSQKKQKTKKRKTPEERHKKKEKDVFHLFCSVF